VKEQRVTVQGRHVFVAGHRGMLGHVVVRVFEAAGWVVETDEQRFTGEPDDALLERVVASDAEVVVNALGITTQRGVADHRLFRENAVFPQLLAARVHRKRLIHASTDCVFDGQRGGYDVNDVPDELGAYGLSKRLGELCAAVPGADVVIFRTSLVGPEPGSARGLMAWFLAQAGPVRGWSDHRWNGITTLRWARLALDAAEGRIAAGIHQPTTDDEHTKLEMLQHFAEVFDHDIPIEPAQSGQPIDRTLRPTIAEPPFVDQLVELRDWIARDR
jgi:dTDP-4-dehydrorhamnose reductase